MFAFADRNIVKKVVSFLPRVGVGARYGLPQQRYSIHLKALAPFDTHRSFLLHLDEPRWHHPNNCSVPQI